MWECGSVVILNYYHCLITKDAINFYKDILGGIFTSSVILVLATAPPSLEREWFFTGLRWSQHIVWQISWQRPPFVWGHLSSVALQLCSYVAQVGPGPVAGWRHGWPLGAGCCCPGQGAPEHRLVSPPATATIAIQHTYRLSVAL